MIEYLTIEGLLLLARELGVGPVRDLGPLDSASHRPLVIAVASSAITYAEVALAFGR